MPADSDVTTTISGIASTDGATLAPQTWTFHTKSATASDENMFGSQTPALTADNDSSAVEVGVGWSPAVDGTVSAIRFYKGAGNGGTHTGSIWSSTGTKLASVTFTNETDSGWQTATLATPLAVTAGTQYVVSYYAPQGHYAVTNNFFTSDWTSGNLTASADNNGLYLYATGGGFPTYTYGKANYFVDVTFRANAAASIKVTGRSPAPGDTGVARNNAVSETFSAPIVPGYSMSLSSGGSPVAGTTSLSSDAKTLTFTPSSAMPSNSDVTVTVSGVVSQDGASLGTDTWTFHTSTSTGQQVSMFSTATPTAKTDADSGAIELGTAFTPSVNGTVTALKFYKGTGSTGTHTGSLWGSDGTRLATVTYTNETASGWQTAALATPVALTAGQTYVVSYYAPNGHYASSDSFFTGPWTQGPLTAPKTQNGRYLYASGGGFPTQSYHGTNYFADVVFSY